MTRNTTIEPAAEGQTDVGLPPAAPRGTTQIYGIDVIRFLAASFVAFYHLGFAIWASPHRPPVDTDFAGLQPAAWLLSTGWTGVEIFFVISGFVIAYTANGRAPLAFARSRFLRLWPAVLVCATLSVPALLAIGVPMHEVAKDYLHSLTFYPLGPWMGTAYWSLPVEIVFYALIFALIALDAFRRIEPVAYALGGVSAAVWLLYAATDPSTLAGQATADLVFNRYAAMMLVHHGVYFAGGITLWLIASRGLTLLRGLWLSIFAMAALVEVANQASATAGFMHVPVSTSLSVAVFLGGMAAIAVSIVANRPIARLLAPVLPAVRLLGLASYPLYLLHEPIGTAVIVAAKAIGLGDWPAMLAGYGAAFGLAMVVVLLVEPAARGWTQGLIARAERRLPAGWLWVHRTSVPL